MAAMESRPVSSKLRGSGDGELNLLDLGEDLLLLIGRYLMDALRPELPKLACQTCHALSRNRSLRELVSQAKNRFSACAALCSLARSKPSFAALRRGYAAGVKLACCHIGGGKQAEPPNKKENGPTANVNGSFLWLP